MFTSFEKCSHGAFEDRRAWDPSHWLWVKKKHLPIWSKSLQPLERTWRLAPVFLPGKSHDFPGRLRSMGPQRVEYNKLSPAAGSASHHSCGFRRWASLLALTPRNCQDHGSGPRAPSFGSSLCLAQGVLMCLAIKVATPWSGQHGRSLFVSHRENPASPSPSSPRRQRTLRAPRHVAWRLSEGRALKLPSC